RTPCAVRGERSRSCSAAASARPTSSAQSFASSSAVELAPLPGDRFTAATIADMLSEPAPAEATKAALIGCDNEAIDQHKLGEAVPRPRSQTPKGPQILMNKL